MRKFRPSIVVACAGASLLLSAPAAAAQFNFAYSGSAGSGISGNGVITTGEADPSGSFFNPSLLVTSITGVFNGNAITGLLAPGSFFKTSGLFGSPGNDNILYYPSSQSFLGQPTYLDRYGLAFKTSTEQVNLFFGLGGYGSIMQNQPRGRRDVRCGGRICRQSRRRRGGSGAGNMGDVDDRVRDGRMRDAPTFQGSHGAFVQLNRLF